MVTKRRSEMACACPITASSGRFEAAQDERAEITAERAGKREGDDHVERAFPEGAVGEAAVADEADDAHLLPAARDLRFSRAGGDRKSPHEPLRLPEVAAVGNSLDDELAFRVGDADEFVVAAVEERRGSQLDVDGVGLFLRERRASAVALSAFLSVSCCERKLRAASVEASRLPPSASRVLMATARQSCRYMDMIQSSRKWRCFIRILRRGRAASGHPSARACRCRPSMRRHCRQRRRICPGC